MPLSGLICKDLQGKSCLQIPLLTSSNPSYAYKFYCFKFQSQETALPHSELFISTVWSWRQQLLFVYSFVYDFPGFPGL